MSKPMIRIHNANTNEVIDRQMNDEEFAQYEKDMANREIRKNEKLVKEAAKAALIERLGLTQEEFNTLLA